MHRLQMSVLSWYSLLVWLKYSHPGTSCFTDGFFGLILFFFKLTVKYVNPNLHHRWVDDDVFIAFSCMWTVKHIFCVYIVYASNCVPVRVKVFLCYCSQHCGLCQQWNTKCSVSWKATSVQQETWHGLSSENCFHCFFIFSIFSVALSLNHQQKIKIIIVMNSLTGLCNSGWIYECLYNKSTVVWGNPAVSLGADDYENHVGIHASVFSVS